MKWYIWIAFSNLITGSGQIESSQQLGGPPLKLTESQVSMLQLWIRETAWVKTDPTGDWLQGQPLATPTLLMQLLFRAICHYINLCMYCIFCAYFVHICALFVCIYYASLAGECWIDNGVYVTAYFMIFLACNRIFVAFLHNCVLHFFLQVTQLWLHIWCICCVYNCIFKKYNCISWFCACFLHFYFCVSVHVIAHHCIFQLASPGPKGWAASAAKVTLASQGCKAWATVVTIVALVLCLSLRLIWTFKFMIF